MQDSAAAHQLSQEGWRQLSCLKQSVTNTMIACSAVLSARLLLSDDFNSSAHSTASLSATDMSMGGELTAPLLLTTSTSMELHQDKSLLGSGINGDSCTAGSHSSSGTACVMSLSTVNANASAGCKVVSRPCTDSSDAPSCTLLGEAELLQLQQACGCFVRSCRPLLGQLQGYQEVAAQLAARQAARAAAAAAASTAAESSPSCRSQRSRWAGLLSVLRRGRLRRVLVSGSAVVLGGVLTYCWWLHLKQREWASPGLKLMLLYRKCLCAKVPLAGWLVLRQHRAETCRLACSLQHQARLPRHCLPQHCCKLQAADKTSIMPALSSKACLPCSNMVAVTVVAVLSAVVQ